MQQAARVADMTAFFSVEVDEGTGKRTGVPCRVRRDVEDLHDAGRQAHGGLRGRAVRKCGFPSRRSSTSSSCRCAVRASPCCARSGGAVEAVCSQDVELADEVIAFDDDIDSQFFEVEQGIELLLARQTPVASDLRLVLALLKDNPTSSGWETSASRSRS